MTLIARIKQFFARGRSTMVAQPRRTTPAAAGEYIVIANDGSTHTFVAGTTGYGKGHEPPSGHRPIAIVECVVSTPAATGKLLD